MRLFIGFGLVVLMLSGSPAAVAANIGNPAYTDPGKTDADFPFQGEYVGEITHDGQPLRFGVQVIALGEGAFEAVAYPGGLPGAGWTPPNKINSANLLLTASLPMLQAANLENASPSF